MTNISIEQSIDYLAGIGLSITLQSSDISNLLNEDAAYCKDICDAIELLKKTHHKIQIAL